MYHTEIIEGINNYPNQGLKKVFYNMGHITRDASGQFRSYDDIRSAMGKPYTRSEFFIRSIRRHLILLYVIFYDILPQNVDSTVRQLYNFDSTVRQCIKDIESFIEHSQNLSEDTIRELNRRADQCRELV
ncbi:MAG: hypothetical protein F4W91_21770 [Gemmatimonadetes bacterium]|nr:hypothetical protein [Gemmatimonadota bacterium]